MRRNNSIFFAINLDGAVNYDWTLPSGATIVDDLGDMVILSFESFTEDQNVNISVLASNDVWSAAIDDQKLYN